MPQQFVEDRTRKRKPTGLALLDRVLGLTPEQGESLGRQAMAQAPNRGIVASALDQPPEFPPFPRQYTDVPQRPTIPTYQEPEMGGWKKVGLNFLGALPIGQPVARAIDPRYAAREKYGREFEEYKEAEDAWEKAAENRRREEEFAEKKALDREQLEETRRGHKATEDINRLYREGQAEAKQRELEIRAQQAETAAQRAQDLGEYQKLMAEASQARADAAMMRAEAAQNRPAPGELTPAAAAKGKQAAKVRRASILRKLEDSYRAGEISVEDLQRGKQQAEDDYKDEIETLGFVEDRHVYPKPASNTEPQAKPEQTLQPGAPRQIPTNPYRRAATR